MFWNVHRFTLCFYYLVKKCHPIKSNICFKIKTLEIDNFSLLFQTLSNLVFLNPESVNLRYHYDLWICISQKLAEIKHSFWYLVELGTIILNYCIISDRVIVHYLEIFIKTICVCLFSFKNIMEFLSIFLFNIHGWISSNARIQWLGFQR